MSGEEWYALFDGKGRYLGATCAIGGYEQQDRDRAIRVPRGPKDHEIWDRVAAAWVLNGASIEPQLLASIDNAARTAIGRYLTAGKEVIYTRQQIEVDRWNTQVTGGALLGAMTSAQMASNFSAHMRRVAENAPDAKTDAQKYAALQSEIARTKAGIAASEIVETINAKWDKAKTDVRAASSGSVKEGVAHAFIDWVTTI